MKLIRPTVLLVILALSTTGCFSLNKPYQGISYHTLEYPPPTPANHPQLPVMLRVDRFGVAEAYNSGRIVYRDAAYARNSYVYHRWRTNPAPMIRDFLERDLRQSGICRAVLPPDSRLPADYELTGKVEEILEWDEREGRQAVLAIQITLLDAKTTDATRQVVFQATFSTRKQCPDNTPQGLAAAMSSAMTELSGRIVEAVHDHMQ